MVEEGPQRCLPAGLPQFLAWEVIPEGPLHLLAAGCLIPITHNKDIHRVAMDKLTTEVAHLRISTDIISNLAITTSPINTTVAMGLPDLEAAEITVDDIGTITNLAVAGTTILPGTPGEEAMGAIDLVI